MNEFNFKKKRRAFTLAEALLTLLVVSLIVAAIMPVITRKHSLVAEHGQWLCTLKDNNPSQHITRLTVNGKTLYSKVTGSSCVFAPPPRAKDFTVYVIGGGGGGGGGTSNSDIAFQKETTYPNSLSVTAPMRGSYEINLLGGGAGGGSQSCGYSMYRDGDFANDKPDSYPNEGGNPHYQSSKPYTYDPKRSIWNWAGWDPHSANTVYSMLKGPRNLGYDTPDDTKDYAEDLLKRSIKTHNNRTFTFKDYPLPPNPYCYKENDLSPDRNSLYNKWCKNNPKREGELQLRAIHKNGSGNFHGAMPGYNSTNTTYNDWNYYYDEIITKHIWSEGDIQNQKRGDVRKFCFAMDKNAKKQTCWDEYPAESGGSGSWSPTTVKLEKGDQIYLTPGGKASSGCTTNPDSCNGSISSAKVTGKSGSYTSSSAPTGYSRVVKKARIEALVKYQYNLNDYKNTETWWQQYYNGNPPPPAARICAGANYSGRDCTPCGSGHCSCYVEDCSWECRTEPCDRVYPLDGPSYCSNPYYGQYVDYWSCRSCQDRADEDRRENQRCAYNYNYGGSRQSCVNSNQNNIDSNRNRCPSISTQYVKTTQNYTNNINTTDKELPKTYAPPLCYVSSSSNSGWSGGGGVKCSSRAVGDYAESYSRDTYIDIEWHEAPGNAQYKAIIPVTFCGFSHINDDRDAYFNDGQSKAGGSKRSLAPAEPTNRITYAKSAHQKLWRYYKEEKDPELTGNPSIDAMRSAIEGQGGQGASTLDDKDGWKNYRDTLIYLLGGKTPVYDEKGTIVDEVNEYFEDMKKMRDVTWKGEDGKGGKAKVSLVNYSGGSGGKAGYFVEKFYSSLPGALTATVGTGGQGGSTQVDGDNGQTTILKSGSTVMLSADGGQQGFKNMNAPATSGAVANGSDGEQGPLDSGLYNPDKKVIVPKGGTATSKPECPNTPYFKQNASNCKPVGGQNRKQLLYGAGGGGGGGNKSQATSGGYGAPGVVIIEW